MTFIYWLGWVTLGSAFRAFYGLRIEGREHLITEGAVLVASNHQSYMDPPLLANLYDTPMFFLARKTLFRGFCNWLYRQWGAFPLDQQKPDLAGLKHIIRLLKAGERVAIFPEGSRSMDGSIADAAPGVGFVAAKSGALIQPVRIRGAFEALPRGVTFLRPSRITLTIGPAIRLTPAELKQAAVGDGYDLLAKRIMLAIRQL
ncbi:MAG: lysophospholipid acyltransferase family protein [Verrucomicrobiota bacterium]